MSNQKITVEFADILLADSAIGRLEVLGVPPRDITKDSVAGDRVAVTAIVEDRLAEKARLILQSDENAAL